MGVEAQNPIADDLESDTAVLRRPASRGAVVDRSDSQQRPLRPVLRALGKRPQSTRIVIFSEPIAAAITNLLVFAKPNQISADSKIP